jgi:two-component sensor histidine kinase
VLRHENDSYVMMAYRDKLELNFEKTVFWIVTAPACILFIQELFRMRGRVQKLIAHVAGGLAYILLSATIHTGWSSIRFPHFVRIITNNMGTHAPATMNYFLIVLPEACLAYGIVLGAVVLAHSITAQRLREREASAAALRASQAESQLASTRLATLRSQLQPHFLFNTLNGISALTEAEPSHARNMLAQLSGLLRRAIETEHDEVPLGQELEWVESYLDLQQTRFNDRINVELRIDPDAISAYVPHLILQPLLENALEHGFANRRDAAELIIEAIRIGDTLHLSVGDNGLGLDSVSANANGRTHTGIGLSNTRERLAALFGSKATLALAQRQQGGTEATIVMPFHTAPLAHTSRRGQVAAGA